MLSLLLQGVVDHPTDFDRHLILSDWLEEYDDPRRAELLRLHRQLLATCTEPDKHPGRAAWQARIVALLQQGVQPVVPRQTVDLGSGVTLEMAWIDGFWMGVHQVTQAQWQAVMGSNPSHFKGDDLPVETVSWHDCQDFCRRLSERNGKPVRLPTEAEWEYACRAGTTTEFWWGDTATSHQANFDGNYPYSGAEKGPYLGRTSPVGSYLPNPFGLYDVHGNVWEWCSEGEQRPNPTLEAAVGAPTPRTAGRRPASGSRRRTGSTSSVLASAEDEQRPDPTVARSGCTGAGAGSASPGTAGRRTAPGSTRRSGATPWASALPEGEQRPDPTESSGAGAGTATPGTAGRRSATGTTRRLGTATSVSGSAEGEQSPDPTFAAGAGAAPPGTASRRTATGSTRRSATTPWASDSPEYDARVLRGGSWYDSPQFCCAAFRLRIAPGYRDQRCGCRVVLCLD